MDACQISQTRMHMADLEEQKKHRPAKRTSVVERGAKDDQSLLYKISMLLDSKQSLKHCRGEDGRIVRVRSIEPIFTEEEEEALLEEGAPIPTALPLTKSEEHIFKKVRRKIKNKISAQESRRKKKEYMDGLERRTDQTYSENKMLRQRLESQENTIRTLILELNNMQASLRKEREGNRSDGGKRAAPVMVNKTTQTGICLKCLQAKRFKERRNEMLGKVNQSVQHKSSDEGYQTPSPRTSQPSSQEKTRNLSNTTCSYEHEATMNVATVTENTLHNSSTSTREESISAFSVPALTKHTALRDKPSDLKKLCFPTALPVQHKFSATHEAVYHNIKQELFRYDPYTMISSY